TTVANAYIQPVINSYLQRLSEELRAQGYPGELYVMTSGGGILPASVAARKPIALLESGPAGAVVAAIRAATSVGLDDLVAFDMGGTTAKICVVEDRKPSVSAQSEVGRAQWHLA